MIHKQGFSRRSTLLQIKINHFYISLVGINEFLQADIKLEIFSILIKEEKKKQQKVFQLIAHFSLDFIRNYINTHQIVNIWLIKITVSFAKVAAYYLFLKCEIEVFIGLLISVIGEQLKKLSIKRKNCVSTVRNLVHSKAKRGEKLPLLLLTSVRKMTNYWTKVNKIVNIVLILWHFDQFCCNTFHLETNGL